MVLKDLLTGRSWQWDFVQLHQARSSTIFWLDNKQRGRAEAEPEPGKPADTHSTRHHRTVGADARSGAAEKRRY